MEKPSKELLGAIALVLAIVAAGHLWVGAADACALQSSELLAEIRKANGCFEFWTNRYQTTVQTAFSSVIGLVGIVLILRQLRAMHDQNAAARIQTAAAAAGALERRLEQVRSWRESARGIKNFGQDVESVLKLETATPQFRTGLRLLSEASLEARKDLAAMAAIDVDEAIAKVEGEADFRSLADDFIRQVAVLDRVLKLRGITDARFRPPSLPQNPPTSDRFHGTRTLAEQVMTHAEVVEGALRVAEEQARENLRKQHVILRSP